MARGWQKGTGWAVLAACYVLLGWSFYGVASSPPALNALEMEVSQTYPDVAHVAPTAIAPATGSGDDVVFFDVRETEEFAVSRIAGAQRIDPDIGTAEFLRRIGDVTGKKVVFYCSVGVRSSMLAGRVQEVLRARGAAAVYNLSGGIFRWHNERRPLSARNGRTDKVHPYSSYWSRYLKRQGLASYRP